MYNGRFVFPESALRSLLRTVFKPLLAPLERGDDAYLYKKSHRVVLIVVSALFLFLATLSLILAPSVDYLFPVLIFGGAGLYGLLIGTLGEDIAVARLWGSRHV